MKNPTPAKLNFVYAALLALAASPARAVVSASVATGVRSADFSIAPTTRGVTLAELQVRAATDPLVELPAGISLSAGAAFAYQTLNHALGAGLASFSGVSFGPDLRAELKLNPRVKPFLAAGYRLGRYTGKGQENWSSETIPAQFYFTDEVNAPKAKRFNSAGAHLTAGCTATVWQQISVEGEVDLGLEQMSSDTRVIDGRFERPDRTDGGFASRALLVGARVDI